MEEVRRLAAGAVMAGRPDDRRIAYWLFGVAALIFVMVLVGGATRLTESGLSIVRWDPISGILPPMTASDWQAEFAHYQQSPQYQKVNQGMSLDEFKVIFWWEYGHRLLGRVIGFAFLLPFVAFWLRGAIRPELRPKLVLLFLFGGLQGALGWFMVQSGLVDRPSVSHYRLAAHLSLAFFLYGYALWLALDLIGSGRERSRWQAPPALMKLFAALGLAVAVQIVFGAFVAGLGAGTAFNTWPSMDGSFLPAGFSELQPMWLNLFENPGTIQFTHRMIAYGVALLAAVLCWRLRWTAPARVTAAVDLVAAVVALQIALGILTLLQAVPVGLGVAHQGGALVLVSALVLLGHRLVKP